MTARQVNQTFFTRFQSAAPVLELPNDELTVSTHHCRSDEFRERLLYSLYQTCAAGRGQFTI
jgi:hypothetical protein